jgi:phosphatidylglycerophosphatase A
MKQLGLFVATTGYLGYFPFAPGTVGSAVGVVLHVALVYAGGPWLEAAAIVALFAVGVRAGTIAETHFGRKDPGHVIVDEVVGQLVTLAALPLTPAVLVAGFFVFRIADIVKPWPARQLEVLPHGLGIMIDDVMAGIYSQLLMRLLVLAAPAWM